MTKLSKIPFNKPAFVGKELDYVKDAIIGGGIAATAIIPSNARRGSANNWAAKRHCSPAAARMRWKWRRCC